MLAALIFLFAVHAPAEDAWDCDYTPRTPAETSGDREYIVLDDGTAEITCYDDRQVDVPEIPSQLDGYTVTGIGNDAISCYYELTSVTIPDSVTVIGDWAFQYCTGFTSVTIPNSVTSIGEKAFAMYFDRSEELVFTVDEGSYAEEYCKTNGCMYRYPGEAN